MIRPWEVYYPAGLAWDTPIAQGTLPGLLARAAERFGAAPAIDFRGRTIS